MYDWYISACTCMSILEQPYIQYIIISVYNYVFAIYHALTTDNVSRWPY